MIIVVMASFGGRGVLKGFFTAPKRSCRLTVDARTALLASLNRMTSLYTVKHHYDLSLLNGELSLSTFPTGENGNKGPLFDQPAKRMAEVSRNASSMGKNGEILRRVASLGLLPLGLPFRPLQRARVCRSSASSRWTRRHGDASTRCHAVIRPDTHFGGARLLFLDLCGRCRASKDDTTSHWLMLLLGRSTGSKKIGARITQCWRISRHGTDRSSCSPSLTSLSHIGHAIFRRFFARCVSPSPVIRRL
jgi:hypothetical protein